jgi:hypothetical protein
MSRMPAVFPIPKRWELRGNTALRATRRSSRIKASGKRQKNNGSRPKKYAAVILTQMVKTKAMPLGNETEMTDEERAILGQWLRDLP